MGSGVTHTRVRAISVGQLLSLSELQLANLESGDNNGTYITGLLG